MPRIFWREARVAALDTAAAREAGLRNGSLARTSASTASRERQTGLSAPMRDLQNRDPEAFADAMDMSFRLAPRRSRPGHTSRPGRD